MPHPKKIKKIMIFSWKLDHHPPYLLPPPPTLPNNLLEENYLQGCGKIKFRLNLYILISNIPQEQ